jgi:protein-tyrosine-phosphatase
MKTLDEPQAAMVLIGFADALSAPEVLWSLVDSGFRVVTFARNGTKPAIRKSRWVEVKYITDPGESVDNALRDLEGLLQLLGMPVLMGLDDASLWLIRELTARLPLRAAGPTGGQADIVIDKRLQLRAAKAAGFLVPETVEIESGAEVSTLPFFPAFVKPALAARPIDGCLGRGRADRIACPEEVAEFATKFYPCEPMLAQPVINGSGEGLFGLAVEDGVICWSGHRRIRMMNPAGSGASACVGVRPDPAICAVAERFLKRINWRGIFMIELLRDKEDRLWFIELNGRPWGSMALARRNGFEYPSWAVRYALDSRFRPQSPPLTESPVCRHLGREILHLGFVWRATKGDPGWPRRMEALREVMRLGGNESWYNYNKQDQKVFWAETWQTVAQYLHPRPRKARKKARLIFRVFNRLQGYIVRRRQEVIRARGEVPRLLSECKVVLFLCYGNINRSALAEQHLKQLLGPEAQVLSCGFHTPDCRPLDPKMRSLSGEFGIFFESWSSRTINRKLIARADFIFAMESAHLVRLFSEYPETRGRAFLLSTVTKPGTIPLEVRDPFRGTSEAYRRCIQEVTYATTIMSEALKNGV